MPAPIIQIPNALSPLATATNQGDITPAQFTALEALKALYDAGGRMQLPLAAATATGGPVAALDKTIAASADEALIVEVDMTGVNLGGGVHYWRLRINGAEPAGVGYNVYKEGAGLSSEENKSDGTHFPMGFTRDASPYSARVEIGKRRNSRRLVRVWYGDVGAVAVGHQGFVVGSIPTDAITSVGMQSSTGAAVIVDGSTVAAAVRVY